MILVMTKNLTTDEGDVWIFYHDELNPYVSWREDGGLDANGGVASMTLAGDIYRSLLKAHFIEYELSGRPRIDALKDPPICEFDYSGIRYYESGDWNKEDPNERF